MMRLVFMARQTLRHLFRRRSRAIAARETVSIPMAAKVKPSSLLNIFSHQV